MTTSNYYYFFVEFRGLGLPRAKGEESAVYALSGGAVDKSKVADLASVRTTSSRSAPGSAGGSSVAGSILSEASTTEALSATLKPFMERIESRMDSMEQRVSQMSVGGASGAKCSFCGRSWCPLVTGKGGTPCRESMAAAKAAPEVPKQE